MHTKTHKQSARCRSKAGFALVVTLSLMILLTVIAVGLLSLSAISLRSSSSQNAQAEARANARLALMIALGELQKHAGPDQRVTTNGTFVTAASANGFGKEPKDVTNPWITGVWQRKSRQDAPLDPNLSNYDPQPIDAGKTVWIVSGNEVTGTGPTTPTSTIANPTATNSPSAWMLRRYLQDANVSAADLNLLSVKVPLVKAGNSAYGYWVSDESQKATAALVNYRAEDYAGHTAAPSKTELVRLGMTAQTNGIDRISGLDASPAAMDEIWRRVFTLPAIEVTAGGAAGTRQIREGLARNFHALAAQSNTLQTDAKLGGLKRDLSIAFEMDDATFNKDRFFTREGQARGSNSDANGISLEAFNFRNTSSTWSESFFHEMMFYEDSDSAPLYFKPPPGSGGGFLRMPTWHALRDFYRTYQRVLTPDTEPTLAAVPTGMLSNSASSVISAAHTYTERGNTGSSMDTYPTRFKYPPGVPKGAAHAGSVLINPTKTGFKPVVARMQIGYSFISESVVSGDGNVVPRTTKIKLVADPIVTLWNPYNVRLNVAGFSLDTFLPDMMVVIEKQEQYVPGRNYAIGDQCISNSLVYEAKIATNRNPAEFPEDWIKRDVQQGWILASNARVENISRNYGGSNMIINFGTGSTASAAFTLEPGELVVYSPNTNSPVDYTGSTGWTFNMKRGWNEEGGIAFDRLRVNTDRPDGQNAIEYFSNVRSRVWVDSTARVRMTIEPYRSWGNSWALADPFGFVARYPEPKWGFRRANADGDSDSLTNDNEGMPYRELLRIAGSTSTARVREGFGITAHFGSRKQIGVHNGDIPNPGMSDVFNVTELSPNNKRWLGSFDWYLRNEADVDNAPVVMGKVNPRFEFNNLSLGPTLHPYGRVTVMPFQLLFRRETSPKNMTQLDAQNRGFWGPSHTASGETHVPMFEVPAAPLTSLGQFQHFQFSPLDSDPAYVVANADAKPEIARNRTSAVTNITNYEHTMLDRSWYANEVLFDTFFLSTLRQTDVPSVVDSEKPLRNPRFSFINPAAEAKNTIKTRLLDAANRPHEKTAANLWMRGGFNVNSTSVEAWKAFLAGTNGIDVALAEPGSSINIITAQDVVFSRFSTPNGDKGKLWRGYRELNDAELTRLAEEIAREVRTRGPFLSLADFVNRRLKDDATGDAGTLEAAIRRTGLNSDFSISFDTSTFDRVIQETGSTANYPFPQQAIGPVAQGAAPGFLQQGDILQSIAPALTVRGDTFLIRGYGESRNSGGQIQARAWCEATVQRTPNYLVHTTDAGSAEADLPWTAPDQLKSPINRRFGRQFQIINFRWLNETEV
jgi:hypothetical protein